MIRSLRERCGLPGLAILLMGLPGCGLGSRASLSDPEQARAALHAALDAWKHGKPVSSLEAQSPRIHVSDPDWNSGARLAGYRDAGQARQVGYDVNCLITLEFRDRRGKSIEKHVSYVVTTSPQLLVLRND
jgi:hypothetical protein